MATHTHTLSKSIIINVTLNITCWVMRYIYTRYYWIGNKWICGRSSTAWLHFISIGTRRETNFVIITIKLMNKFNIESKCFNECLFYACINDFFLLWCFVYYKIEKTGRKCFWLECSGKRKRLLCLTTNFGKMHYLMTIRLFNPQKILLDDGR